MSTKLTHLRNEMSKYIRQHKFFVEDKTSGPGVGVMEQPQAAELGGAEFFPACCFV
jgi:hypothetical protein